MAVGYDSGELRRSFFTYQQISDWLASIAVNRNDVSWLQRHAEEVYHAIRLAYTWRNDLPERATRALLDISRFMLTRADPHHRWWKLYVDALTEAYTRRDYVLIHEIYAYFGQASLLRGDVKRARVLFGNIIRDVSAVLKREHWTVSEWSVAEQGMLAYIGLIKVETWDYSETFDDDVIENALALARRLNDSLLNDLLYQALASAYAHRQECEKAVGYALTSLGYSFTREDGAHALMTAVVLASAYRKAGLFDQAHEALAFAHRLLQRADHPQAAALAAYEQGVLDYYRGNFESSEKWVLRAQEGFGALRWKRQMTMTEHMLGNIAVERGRYDLAKLHLLRALAMWEKFNNVYEQTSVLYDLANVAYRSGHLNSARQYVAQSLDVARQIPPMRSREWLLGLIHDLRDKLAEDMSRTPPSEA